MLLSPQSAGPVAQEHPRAAPKRAPRRAREARMYAVYMCFTYVLRRARFALFFDRAKDIVKHVLRQPGPRQSFGLAGVLAREPQPNAAFFAQRHQNLVETE